MNRQDFYDGKLFDAYRYMGATHKVVSFYSTPTKLKKVRCTNTASTDQMETGRNIVIPMDLRWN